jgi:hypothetical protein
LDTISSVSAAVHNIASMSSGSYKRLTNLYAARHSTTARHIPTTKGQIDRLNAEYCRLHKCNAETIGDTGTKEPVAQTLNYLQHYLGLVNGTLPSIILRLLYSFELS